MPDAIELRHAPRRIVSQTAFFALLAVGASLLIASFSQAPLLELATRIGDIPLAVGWSLCLTLFTLAVWWQTKTFTLRVDVTGIYRTAGWSRCSVKWSDISSAIAREPHDTTGQEYREQLTVIFRDSNGRKLLTLGYDVGGTFPAEQVRLFKRYVRVQLQKNAVALEGPPLAWINWE